MIIGVLKESEPETRVSLPADAVSQWIKKGMEVWVEYGAGLKAFNSDENYLQAGAQLKSPEEIIRSADIILSIQLPEQNFESWPGSPKIMVGVYHPLMDPEKFQRWCSKGVTLFSLDMLPRSTRAQSMDVLSSQANIAGYKAAIKGALLLPRYFPMFMTAAGSIAPARVLVIGAGVAGLQAVATARRLGAVVEVFDTRPAVKEEVMSLGGKFIEVEGASDPSQAGGYAVEQTESYKQKQKERIGESVAKVDVIITTAQIPGKKAPLLITEEMIQSMKKGSVIIDLAASTGGNTPFTKEGETIQKDGVMIVGEGQLAMEMPQDASKLYGKNISNFLALLFNAQNELQINFDDDLLKSSCITHGGAIVNERMK